MEMRTGVDGISGIPYGADQIPGLYLLPLLNQLGVQVGIVNIPAVFQLQPDLLTAAAAFLYFFDHTVRNGKNSGAAGSSYIHTLVPAFASIPGIAEIGDHIGQSLNAS